MGFIRSLVIFLLLAPLSAQATVFMSQQEAIDGAFGRKANVERQTFFLTPAQLAQVKKLGGGDGKQGLVVRYVARENGRLLGYLYFDAHRVRTLAETVMFVVTPAGTIDRVEILSFNEPQEYLPKSRWLDQFRGRKLDADLNLKRSIRPITGATLSGRAIVDASRKVLAIHSTLTAAPPPGASASK
jgi:hypothetical protein